MRHVCPFLFEVIYLTLPQFSEICNNLIVLIFLLVLGRVGSPSPHSQPTVTCQGTQFSLSLSHPHGPSVCNARALTCRNSCALVFQLQQEIEDWSKSHAELSEQIKSFEKSKIDTEVALTDKDGDVNVSLFACLMLGNSHKICLNVIEGLYPVCFSCRL